MSGVVKEHPSQCTCYGCTEWERRWDEAAAREQQRRFERAITLQDDLAEPLQRRLESALNGADRETLRTAIRHLLTGLRLNAVSPTHDSAIYCAWNALYRAWREAGLSVTEFESIMRGVGYEWPKDSVALPS